MLRNKKYGMGGAVQSFSSPMLAQGMQGGLSGFGTSGLQTFAKGGEIAKDFYVVVRLPKGLVNKKDFDGFSKDEIIQWCEERGWKYNSKGEKLGGQLLKNYEFFVKESKRVNVGKLPYKKYAKGGEIIDQYEGKTPADIWFNLTKSQRRHLLLDHANIPSGELSSYIGDDTSFDELPHFVKQIVKKHFAEGQYARGGKLSPAQERAFFDKTKTKFTESDAERLVGKFIEIYGQGQDEPIAFSKIAKATIDPKYSQKTLVIYTEMGTQERIPEDKIDAFFNGLTIVLSIPSKGSYYGLKLKKEANKYADGGTTRKSGNVPRIAKKVAEVNALIEKGNELGVEVVDSSSTWQSPMKYKPIKYVNGILYIEYEELDLYSHLKRGINQWKLKKDKVLKRNMEFDNPLNDIAKMYRKAIREREQYFSDGGEITHLPEAKKVSKEDIEQFIRYVDSFYGKNGVYADYYEGVNSKAQIRKAVMTYLNKLDSQQTWGGGAGDSLDRERVGQILKPTSKPTYAKGGDVEDRNRFNSARTTGRDSKNWEAELKEYAGEHYKSLTSREREEIIADMQRGYDRNTHFAKGGKTSTFEVHLEAVPNRDFDQSSHEANVRVPKLKKSAKSVAEAVSIAKKFIQDNDLGGSNFLPAKLYKNGKQVGFISYNGRVWNNDQSEMKYANGGSVNRKQSKFQLGDKVYSFYNPTKSASIVDLYFKAWDTLDNIPHENDTYFYELSLPDGTIKKLDESALSETPLKVDKSVSKNMDVQFIEYKDNEIMYEPTSKKYYANDVEFDSLLKAKKFLDSGKVSSNIREAYKKGLFAQGGQIKPKTSRITLIMDGQKYSYPVALVNGRVEVTEETFKDGVVREYLDKEFDLWLKQAPTDYEEMYYGDEDVMSKSGAIEGAMEIVISTIEEEAPKKMTFNFDEGDVEFYEAYQYAKGGEVVQLPPKGELTNRDNLLLKYQKVGSNYEFYVYEPISKEVSGYNQIKFVCKNSDCALKMNYKEFINYLYSELYLDDKKFAKGGEVKNTIDILMTEEPKVWDKFDFNSGSEIRASKDKTKKYAQELERVFTAKGIKKGSLTKKINEDLTDENYHLLNEFLTRNGYFNNKLTDELLKSYNNPVYSGAYADKEAITIEEKAKPKTSGAKKIQLKKLSKKTTYIPNREIGSIELESGETLSKNDIIDGVYRAKKKFAKGGKIGFEGLAKKVAKRYVGRKVSKEYQAEYGKTYDAKEAKEVGNKVAGKVYQQQVAKKKIVRKLQRKTN